MSEFVRAYEGNEPYIFVSYAHKDTEKVLPVIRELFNRKYRVWYDEGIAPGSEWPHNIERHLKKASIVIAFISKDSLLSKNCENEVGISLDNKKIILQISVDGVSKHKQLPENEALELDGSLIDKVVNANVLGGELIGDGITGYQYSIDKKRGFNIWNLMLGLAAVLAVTFSVSLYGLYNGWFDDLLPAKQPVVAAIAPTAETQEAISIENNIIGSVLPVEFSSDEEKTAVYEKLGWEQSYEMTYKDLMEMDGVTYLEICDEPIDSIEFAAYLPNLEMVTISNPQITDLSPLTECPNLKTVQVTVDMLPITIPELRSFEIEVI